MQQKIWVTVNLTLQDEEDEISSTPALPPSKLLEKLNGHHHKNDKKSISQKQTSSAISDGLSNLQQHNNNLGGTLESDDVASGIHNVIETDDELNSGKCSENFAVECEKNITSTLLGTSINNKSFLNFLNDEENAEMVEPLPSKVKP